MKFALILAMALVAFASPEKDSGRAQQAESYAEKGQSVALPHPPFKAQKSDPYQNRKCDEREDGSGSDLCAQWKAANAASRSAIWAARTFWLTAVGAIIGVIALGAAGYAALYTKRAADAAFAAFSADVLANRPIVQIGCVNVNRTDLVSVRFSNEFNIVASLKNYGATGCWTEHLRLRFAGNPIFEEAETFYDGPFHAFIGPGGEANIAREFAFIMLSDADMPKVIGNTQMFVSGSCIYRDAGEHRWETGFAGIIELAAETYAGSGITPLVGDHHWFDRLLDHEDQPRKN